jgi:hypothetical protein
MNGISAPATSGPAIAPAWKTVMLSEFAAGSSSSGISFGRIALRVGWLIAKNACCTENRHRSSHTLPPSAEPIAAWTKKSALVPIRPQVVTTSRVRRSKWSARAPPHRPKTTRGTRPNTPVRPTYADDPVSA